MDIFAALATQWPGAQYRLAGETYADLEWLDAQIAKPSEVEVNAAWADYQAGALDRYKVAARAKVNAEAGAKRVEFVTDSPLQSLVYQRKGEEASAWLADVAGGGTPDPADYPHISAEIGIHGVDGDAVAALFAANAAAWAALSAQIEGLRQAALVAITAATDEAGVDAAATVDWSVVGA